MRTLLFTVIAIFGILALSLFLFLISNIPAGVRLVAIRALAERCTPPTQVPTNAGNVVVVDLRKPGDRTVFSATPIDTWKTDTIRKIRSQTGPSRDIVIFVHGFVTSITDATCAGEVLQAELAGLPAYATRQGPDILVFGWPGEFSFLHFPAAQNNAARAGHYLANILKALDGKRVFLVAHSLGALVVMTAAADLPQHGDAPPLAGLLLIEGAIPAVSIRDWKETLTVTHPINDLNRLGHGEPLGQPEVYISKGRGSFVAAAANTAHLVVTTAGQDIPLAKAFALDDSFHPFDLNRPNIPPRVGDDSIDAQAIGVPFPTGKVERQYDEMIPEMPTELIDPLHRQPYGPWYLRPALRESETGISIPHPSYQSKVLSHYDWVYDFLVPHASYHEIRLDQGQWWRLLRDWHGAMNDRDIRHRILSESWAIFAGHPS